MRWTAAVIVLGLVGAARGQGLNYSDYVGSDFGTGAASSMFGSRSLGNPISPGSRTAMGGSSRAGGGAGTSGLGGSSLMDQRLGSAGQIDGGDRFVRGNRRPGQFVGADSQDAQNFFSLFANGSRAGAGGVAGRGARAAQVEQPGAGPASQEEIRSTLNLGFTPPAGQVPQLSGSTQRALERIRARRPGFPLEVEVQGPTAILRGEVGSESDRRVVEQLVRLEAGIAHVRNELVVTHVDPLPPLPASP